MNSIKGYIVRMWTSKEGTTSEKMFEGEDLLETRRAAFAYADNLVDIMEEAKQAGVLEYNAPEEILDPEVTIDEVVIGNVHVSVVYEEIRAELTLTDEDIVYMAVPNEGSKIHIPIDETTRAEVLNIENFDLDDDETIRIHNREAWCYISKGGYEGIKIINTGTNIVFLLWDDYLRLRSKQLISE